MKWLLLLFLYTITILRINVQSVTQAKFKCGDPLTINHNPTHGATPLKALIVYNTILTNLSGTQKYWCTQKSGASASANSFIHSTCIAAGRYWKINQKREPVIGDRQTWNNSIFPKKDNWTNSNDPCTADLCSDWRILTHSEWKNVLSHTTKGITAYNTNVQWTEYPYAINSPSIINKT